MKLLSKKKFKCTHHDRRALFSATGSSQPPLSLQPVRRGPKPTVSVLSHCSKWLQFKVAQRATSTAPISGSSSRSESARISYSRPTRSESLPPATLVVCSDSELEGGLPASCDRCHFLCLLLCRHATGRSRRLHTCVRLGVPPSPCRTRLRVCHSALSWAGSGSMDQLGRLPLRVLSIGKYAFQKKQRSHSPSSDTAGTRAAALVVAFPPQAGRLPPSENLTRKELEEGT
jgi:hypothetical protein